jgi:predicted Zn-dependent protease
MSARTVRTSFSLLAIALLALLLAHCVTNPATGRRQLLLLSRGDEVALGKQAHGQILQEFGHYEQAALAAWIEQIGARLAKTSEMPDLPYQFTVLDSPVVNAFALPGGPTYVTRGLLAHANTEAQLAGVMGHEIGHVTARHGAEQMSKAQLTQVGLGLASVLEPKVARYADLIGAGAQLLLLQHSREAEREADRLGMRYMLNVDYDPRGLPQFLQVLDNLQPDGEGPLPVWLSTHPTPGSRVEAMTALAREKVQGTDISRLEVGREDFMRRIDGIVYGEDPREGFRLGDTFHHPELRFQLTFPEGWASINTKQVVATMNDRENPSALLQLTLASGENVPASPTGVAQQAAQQNPELRFQGEPARINGLDAWVGTVRNPSQRGAGPLLVSWIAHDGRMYQLLGQSTAGANALGLLERSIRSFRPETDRQVLDVEPMVLEVVSARGGQTVAGICAGRQLPVPCEKVALINQAEPDDPLERGRPIKVPRRQHPLWPPRN